jgi:hypothetical protein
MICKADNGRITLMAGQSESGVPYVCTKDLEGPLPAKNKMAQAHRRNGHWANEICQINHRDVTGSWAK